MKLIYTCGCMTIALLLAACGKMGPLERPGPLVGNPPPDSPQATKHDTQVRTIDSRNRFGRQPPPELLRPEPPSAGEEATNPRRDP